MKNLIIVIILCLACFTSSAQIYKIVADSVKMSKDSCNTELILENGTRNVNGFLYNKGNGRTEFRKIKLSDSLYLFGNDTVNLYRSIPISALIDAHKINTIQNKNYTQEWKWDSLSGTALKLSTASLSSGIKTMLQVNITGSTPTAGSGIGASINVSRLGTGMTGMNYGVLSNVSGGVNNYAFYGAASANGTSQGYGIYSTAGVSLGGGTPIGGEFSSSGSGTWSGVSLKGIGVTASYSGTNHPTLYGANFILNGDTGTKNVGLMITTSMGHKNYGLIINPPVYFTHPPALSGFLASTDPTAIVHIGVADSVAPLRLEAYAVNPYYLNNGDVWHANNHLYARLNGSTVQLDNNFSTGVPLSSIIAATSTNTIDNLNYAQEWKWDSLSGSTTALKLSSASSSTTGIGQQQKMLEVSLAGNTTSGSIVPGPSYAGYFANTRTISGPGVLTENYGIYAKATGGRQNFAIKAETSTGNIQGAAIVASNLSAASAIWANSAGGTTVGISNYDTITANKLALAASVNGAGTLNVAAEFSALGATNNYGLLVTNGYSGFKATSSAPTALVHIGGSSTSASSLRIESGTAPTSPNNGDVWHASNHLYARLNGSTVQLDGGWNVAGNAGTSPTTNFIGTTDNNALVFRTNNTEKMRIRGDGTGMDGFLGIGTNSPTESIHVFGLNPTLYLEGDSNSYFPRVVLKSHGNRFGTLDPYGIVTNWFGGMHIQTTTANGRSSVGATIDGVKTISTDSTTVTHEVIGALRQTNNIFDVSMDTSGIPGSVHSKSFFKVKNNGKIGLSQYRNNSGEDSVLSTDVSGVVKLKSIGTIIASSGWGISGNAGTSSSTNFLGTTDANPLLFKTNNTERMRIHSNGNIGIGSATDDGQALQVTGQTKLSYSTNSPGLEFSADNNGLSHFLLKNINAGTSAGVGLRYQNDSAILSQVFLTSKGSVFGGNTYFIDQLSGNIALAARAGYIDLRTGSDITSAGTKMRLLANGNVGINTTSPTAKLHVAGTGLFTDTLTATTMGTGDSSNRVATTAYVKQQIPSIDSTLKFQGGQLGVKVDTVLSYFTRNYRSNYAEIHEEFWNGVNELGSDWSGSGSAVAGTATTEANHPGLVQLTTGTQSNGRASVMSYFPPVYMGSGQCYYETQVNIANLSSSGQRYQLVCGLFGTFLTPTQTAGVFFLYDEGAVSTGSTAAAYWQTCSANGGTRTYNTSLTQTTVATGWVKLRIYLDYTAGQASFYINGTLVSTHTANLPSSTDMNFGIALLKSAGTTSRSIKSDYISLQRHFSVAR